MCKFKPSNVKLPASVCLSALLGLGTFLLPTKSARAACTSGGNLGAGLVVQVDNVTPADGVKAHIGDTLTLNDISVNLGGTSCNASNGMTWVVYPNNHNELAMQSFNLLQGGQIFCDSTSHVNDPSCRTITTSWTITLADVSPRTIGITTNISQAQGFAFSCSATTTDTNHIIFLVGAQAQNGSLANFPSGCGQQVITIVHPHISITKECVTNCPPLNAAVYGQPIFFRGTVCNDGDTVLGGITVTDDPATAITFAGTTSSGRTYDSTLNPGECVNYSGNYQPTGNLCGPFSDTVIASGTDNADVPQTVHATNSAVCTVCTSPAISVTKECPPTNGVPGGLLTFSGTVCNTGNVPLTDVTVFNDRVLSTGTNLVASYPLLTNGECRTFSGSEVVPVDVCSITDTLTARGTNICNGVGVVASATTNCPVLTTPQLTVVKLCPATNGLPGGVIGFSVAITNVGNVTVTNIVVVNNQPAPNTPVATIPRLAPGEGTIVSGTEPVPTDVCSITDIVSVSGRDVCNNPISGSANNTCPVQTTPRLTVAKLCPGTNGLPGGVIGFKVAVTNAGNVTVTNIVVVNNQPAANTPVATIPRLAPGEGTIVSGTEPVPTDVCSITDIVSVSGHDVCNNPVSGSATNTCPVLTTPRLALSKACPPVPPAPGGVMTYSGTITNIGDVAITNITLSDAIFGTNAPAPTPSVIARLEPGEGTTFSGSYPVPFDVCSITDTVRASGHDVCNNPVSAGTSATCPVACAPVIKVYKQVLCFSNICEPFSDDLSAQKSALGVRVDPANCPAFCYRITVTNAGNVTLSNLVVSDESVPGPSLDLSACNFPATLAIGGSASCIVRDISHCVNVTNVVTATANGQLATGGSQSVSAQDTNRVTVVPISIACAVLVSTNGGATFIAPPGSGTIVLPLGTPYLVRVVVTNTGLYDLQNVIVTSTGTPLCFSSPTNIDSLAVGASKTIDCNFVCSTVGPTNNYAVSVVGEASQSLGHVCAFNTLGQPIVAQSQCQNSVTCFGTPVLKVYKQVICFSNALCVFDNDLNNQKSANGVRIDPANDADCPAFCYRVTVTNAGNVTLSNLVVADSNLNDTHVLNFGTCFPATLPVGASASCIVSTNHCFNATNIVTATANGLVVDSQTRSVSATDTNMVTVTPISLACRVLVSTNNGLSFAEYHSPNCPLVTLGNSYIVRIVVTNTGQYALHNVTITNTGTPLCFTSPLNIGELAIGGSANVDCTNLCSAISTNNYSVAVGAVASQTSTLGTICDFNIQGKEIVAQSACDTCVICYGCPQIKVLKGIACVVCTNTDGTGVQLFCASFNGNFNSIAYGVRSDTQNPAFCYSIIVSNAGDVQLTAVRVVDDKLGASGLVDFPGTLAVGQSVTNHYVMAWHDSTTNTVVASAQGSIGCPGTDVATGRVSSTNFAVAVVTPASITCAKLVSVNGSAPKPQFIQTDCNGPFASNVVWSAWVTNSGHADLTNIVISEDLSAGDALPCGPVSIRLIGTLAPGAAAGPIYLCTNVFTECTSTNINNFIRVAAEAAQEGTNCIWDIHGSNIVATTECEALLQTCCPTPARACRVTGGGRQDETDSAGRLDVCPDDVRYVTHGGQVGAPVGNSNCVVLAVNQLGNPCIHGRWTHVRHTKGGLEGNFHARYYDTLDCACLGTGFVSPGTCQYTQGVLVDGVCNPGDRIAGPEPRRAPANKIAFTGVGDWACPEGNREPRACLFRVDIEDRSEPGGYHPGGAKPPADRYRIRIWVLSTAELAELNGAGPDPFLLGFRDCISACHGIDYRDGGVDCSGGPNQCSSTDSCPSGGALTPTITFPGGCPVRLPNIDDGGELKNGNHQIHPQIKDCP